MISKEGFLTLCGEGEVQSVFSPFTFFSETPSKLNFSSQGNAETKPQITFAVKPLLFQYISYRFNKGKVVVKLFSFNGILFALLNLEEKKIVASTPNHKT